MENKFEFSCKQIHNSKEPVVSQVERTYNDSFPVEERRPFELIRELVEDESAFSLYVVEKDGKYAGFITLWDLGEFVYVEHFAIDANARNGGIGGKVIEYIKRNVGKPIVLEVELPMDELAKRRISFYERFGFTLDQHIYFQPPYHLGSDKLELRLMGTEYYITNERFDEIEKLIHQKVYGV